MNVNAELKKSMSKVRAFFNTPEVIEKKIELFYHEEKTKSEILEMCIDFFLENNGTLNQDTFSSINKFTDTFWRVPNNREGILNHLSYQVCLEIPSTSVLWQVRDIKGYVKFLEGKIDPDLYVELYLTYCQ